MDLNIKDNSIIICENLYKESLLKKFSKNKLFLNVKFYTKKEFFNNYLFGYKDEALYYLVNKYGYKVDVAKMYLKNIYFIDEKKTYYFERLHKLAELKNELIENNLLVYNDHFKKYIENKNIYVLGYSYLDTNELNIFSKINAIYESFDTVYPNNMIYLFASPENEMDFILNKICHLIDEGVSLNNIKLVNVPGEYQIILNRLCKLYDLPIKKASEKNLYSMKITKDFLNNYESDINVTLSKINCPDKSILNRIINICNKYFFIDDYLKVKELIINDFKNEIIDDCEYKNYLECVDLNYPFSDEEYVFVVNFNMGSIPKFIKDEEYITDNIKDEVDLKKTYEINKEIKDYTIKKLKSIKNLTISYVKTINGIEAYPSSLISEMNLNNTVVNEDVFNSYSKKYSMIKYVRMLDNIYKYGTMSKYFEIYKNTFSDFVYNSFDNRFKGVNKDDLYNQLHNKLTLSYSSLDVYNKCAFRYYLNNILKLDEFSDTFDTFIGSMFHDVLEKCFNSNQDVQIEIDNYIKEKKKVLTPKESFYVNKVKEDIQFVIEVLSEQKKYTSLNESLYEKLITIDKSKDIPVTFLGYIDKILYHDYGNKTIAAIIDYKTGNVEYDLRLLPYGFSMQLPIYLYLLSKSGLFNNLIVAGFYIQYILNKNINMDSSKTYIEQKKANLKLNGYSINDATYLEMFDNSYENSKLINSMKTKSDGTFGAYAKILSEKQMNKIVNLVDEKIDSAITEILSGNFTINPKKIGYDNDVGCKFCKFKDICLKKENDYILYESINDLSFLGGDENA